jgi:hypothetical protein
MLDEFIVKKVKKTINGKEVLTGVCSSGEYENTGFPSP